MLPFGRLAPVLCVAGLAWAAGLGPGCASGEEYVNWDGGDSSVPAADAGADGVARDATPDDAAQADAARDGAAADAGQTDAGQTDGSCTVNGTTPDSCGPCGVVCPGYGQSTAVVGCVTPDCTFSCKAEAYDCNGNKDDGCEVADTHTGTHTQATAYYVGSFSCYDDESQQNISGLLPTDARAHEPAIAGFNAAIGGAPDWYRIHGSGGPLCQDDINLTLTVAGSATLTCFQLRAITNVSTYACATSAGGTCTISPGMSSYGDGTDIYLVVEKTCNGVVAERVSYTVTGHL